MLNPKKHITCLNIVCWVILLAFTNSILAGCSPLLGTRVFAPQPMPSTQQARPESATQTLGLATPLMTLTPQASLFPSPEYLTPTPTRMPTRTSAPSELTGYVVYDYIVDTSDFTSQIFLTDLDTGEIRQLTSIGSNSLPSWSPDGKQIVFTSSRNGGHNLYVMDKDGSNQQQLTNLEGDELLPDWSPDGSRIVFVAEGDGNAEIYAVDVTTKSTIRLTNNKVIDFSPSWSSNGKSVAFTSEDPKKRGLLQIFTMDADGSNVQQFTDDGDLNGHPVWCPDDTCIVYEHGWDNPKLMVIDLETKEIRPLLTGAYATNPDTHEWWPSKSHQRGYINFAINDTLYAFDINNKKLYSLGLQAIDAALYP